jgi:hypothetical protein
MCKEMGKVCGMVEVPPFTKVIEVTNVGIF